MSPPTVTTEVGVVQRDANPFVGPRSLRYGESIHGRTREIHELCSLLVAQRIVLLYSPSGAGKTSLLEAGLRPELERRDFRLFRTIRVGYDPPDSAEEAGVHNRYVHSVLTCLEEGQPVAARIPHAELAELTLDAYLHRLLDQPGDGESPAAGEPCLIFDQFEELVTLDPSDHEAKAAFVEELGVALRDRGRWALFSMREDFIAQLDPYLGLIPTRLATRYRLDLLGATAASEAAQQLAAGAGARFADEAASVLIDDLRKVRVQRGATTAEELGTGVEPVQLQVVCRQLWSSLDADATTIGVEDVAALGRVDDALADFYVQQVRTVAERTGATEREIRTWFDEELISESGFRAQVLEGPGQHGADVLRELENAHLVRAERRRGTEWYELSHDRLIDPIRASNRAWQEHQLSPLQRESQVWERRGRPAGLLLTGATLEAAETWADAHPSELTDIDEELLTASRAERRRTELEQRAARRRFRVVAAIGAFALVALAAVGYLLIQTRDAEDRAEIQEAEAVRQLEIAEGARQEAEASATQARARELAFLAQNEDDPFMSLGYALEAERVGHDVVPETRAAYAAAVQRVDASRQSAPPLVGEAGTIGAPQWSPDGDLLGTAGFDGAQRWDMRRGAAMDEVRTEMFAAAWSHDVARLAAVSPEIGDVVITHAETGEEVTATGELFADVLAWSPDDARLAGVAFDGSFTIWDSAGQRVGGSTAPPSDVPDGLSPTISWSPDGRLLAISDPEGLIRIWDPAAGDAPLATIDAPGRQPDDYLAPDFEWAPDSRRLATASLDGSVQLWDSRTGARTGATDAGVPIENEEPSEPIVAWSPDGTRLSSAMPDGSVRMFEARTLRTAGDDLAGHSSPLTAIAWSPDGDHVATASTDGTIRLWDGNTHEALGEPLPESTNRISWSPDGRRLVSVSDDGSVRQWRLGADVVLTGHDDLVTSLDWSANGARLATASYDGTVRLWDPPAAESVGRPIVDADAFEFGESPSFAWSPDGSRLATAGLDGSVVIRDTDGTEIGDPLDGHADVIGGIAWSPDGSRLATASYDGTIRVWDPAAGRQVGEPVTDPENTDGDLPSFAWSPDSTRIAVTNFDGSEIRLHDALTVTEPAKVLRGTSPASASGGFIVFPTVAWSPDGDRIASAGFDGAIRLWDPAAGQERELTGHRDVVTMLGWSADGARLASAGYDGTVFVWDAATGAQIGDPVTGIDVFTGRQPFAWSPDGPRLAIARVDGGFTIRDVDDGIDVEQEVPLHEGTVTAITWSPDGARIATGSDDATIRLWAALDEREACALLMGEEFQERLREELGQDSVCLTPADIPDLPLLPIVPVSRPLLAS